MNGLPSMSYLICAVPRCGSTLLARALGGTGRAGGPDEFFPGYEEPERIWRDAFGIRSDAEYFDKLLAARTGPNGVFGLKLLWPQGPAMLAKLRASPSLRNAPPDASPHDLLTLKLGAAPRYIWLRRRNRLAQAISYLRAEGTGTWRSDMPRGGRAANPGVDFDVNLITRYLRLVNGYDLEWGCFFLANRVRMLSITYEDFISSYDETVFKILDFLEVPTDGLRVPPPALRRQGDSRSLEWERQFIEIAKRRGLDLPELIGRP
jgi:LPS sulfotransferase NodH